MGCAEAGCGSYNIANKTAPTTKNRIAEDSRMRLPAGLFDEKTWPLTYPPLEGEGRLASREAKMRDGEG
jgi:hypothetical protein